MKEKLRLAVFGHKRWSREGGVEIVVKELCIRMAQQGCQVTCYNRAGHHVSGAEYDDAGKTEYEGIRQKSVPTIERRGLAAVSSSAFAALYSAFGKYDVVHIHAEGPAFFAWLPKMFGKRVVVTVHTQLGLNPSDDGSKYVSCSVWRNIYRKAIIDSLKLQFVSERDLISEDIPFNIDFMMSCERAAVINQKFYHYIVNEKSLTQTYKTDRFAKELVRLVAM